MFIERMRMIKPLILLFLLLGMLGCTTLGGGFNESSYPGLFETPRSQIQLFYSNPNRDVYGLDDTASWDVFGKRTGRPEVTGGIGIMGVWGF